MKNIEDIIANNRESFDDNDPDSGHVERFRAKLEAAPPGAKESWFQRYNIILKIAASVVIFVGISILIFTNRFAEFRNTVTTKIFSTKLPQELVEVVQYYNVITNRKMSQIDQLAVSDDEARRVKEMAETELKNLEEDKAELEKEYTMNPDNERIMNALQLNQRKRAEILDKILNTMKQIN
jgi:hypothetical protein